MSASIVPVARAQARHSRRDGCVTGHLGVRASLTDCASSFDLSAIVELFRTLAAKE